MKRLLYLTLSLLTGLFLSSCEQKRPEEEDFLVLYTTQMFGNLLPWDFYTDTTKEVSLANFMSLVREQRAVYGDRLIVLDNGNMHTRGLINLYDQYIDTVSEPHSFRAQRFIGYDAVSVGHSDMRIQDVFACVRHDSTACPPTICANLFDRRTGGTFFRSCVCLERKGIRVLIFSLVDEGADFWTPRLAHPDVECREMVSAIRDQIMELRHCYKPDIIIGMVSSDRDIELQKNIPGVDLVISNGDDSQSRNQAGMIRINLMRDEHSDKYHKHCFSTTIDLQQYEPDPEYCEYFAKDIQQMREKYNEKVGSLADNIYTHYGLFSGHDYYRDILHQAQLWAVQDADVSFTNMVNPDDTLPAGGVDMKTICRIFNHENLLVKFQMTGDEIVRTLEDFYGMQYNTMSSPKDPLLAQLHDNKGHLRWKPNGKPHLNAQPSHFCSAAGLHYTVDLRRPIGQRIHVDKLRNGRTMHPDSLYTVVTNSYLASKLETLPLLGWNHFEIQRRLEPFDMPNMRYILYRYFSDVPNAYTPTPPEEGDCNFLPDDWWREAKARELMDYLSSVTQ